jgi:hypothetical protein
MLGQGLASDSLEVSEIAEVSAPFVLRWTATYQTLGVGMSVQQLIDQARESLRSSGCRRRDWRKRVHRSSKQHVRRNATGVAGDAICLAYRRLGNPPRPDAGFRPTPGGGPGENVRTHPRAWLGRRLFPASRAGRLRRFAVDVHAPAVPYALAFAGAPLRAETGSVRSKPGRRCFTWLSRHLRRPRLLPQLVRTGNEVAAGVLAPGE